MDKTERSTDNTTGTADLKWWDRFCEVCGWRGGPSDLIQDETAESFYRCPHCRIDSSQIKEVPWHLGDRRYTHDR